MQRHALKLGQAAPSPGLQNYFYKKLQHFMTLCSLFGNIFVVETLRHLIKGTEASEQEISPNNQLQKEKLLAMMTKIAAECAGFAVEVRVNILFRNCV